MAYTDASKVADIVDIETGDSLTRFVTSAHRLVVKFCDPVTEYTDADKEDIETWLAAHFYTCFRRAVVQEQAGGVQETYETKINLRLDATVYGQQAMILDWNGGLAGWNNSAEKIRKVEAWTYWLGNNVDYDEEVGGP